MFALNGLLARGDRSDIATMSYLLADEMLKARKAKDETGIVAVKRSSTTRRSK
jgi:hypothetical protein